MTTYHHPSTALPQPARRAPILEILDRLVDGVGLPLQAHRFGHSHDTDAGEGGTDEDDILAAIRREAASIHEALAHDHGVFVVEVMGSTGSGKTSVLERLIEAAPDEERIGVIVGDVAGDDDARRFEALGVDVANVNTGKECHLDPGLVDGALSTFDLDALDTLYIENVGNMVCPADFPLGAEARILVVSTTEGDDVVRKHPLLFQSADAAVINKTDIADAVGADVATMASDVERTAPDLPVFRTNARAGTGIKEIERYLGDLRGRHHDVATHDHVHTAHDGGEYRHSHEHTHVTADGETYTHTHPHTHDHEHGEEPVLDHEHEDEPPTHEHEHEDEPPTHEHEHEDESPTHDHEHDDESPTRDHPHHDPDAE